MEFTLTAAALPSAQLDVAGFLTGVKTDELTQMTVGRTFAAFAEIRAVAKPAPDLARVMSGDKPVEIAIPQTHRLAALLRINCDVVSGNGGFGACVAGQVLGPGVYLKLPTAKGQTPFLITEVRPIGVPTDIEVRVRLTSDPAFPYIAVGDSDVGYSQNEFSGGGRVVTPPRSANGELTLLVPAYPTLTGWTYAGQPMRVGANLIFVSTRYQLTGLITAVPPLPAKP